VRAAIDRLAVDNVIKMLTRIDPPVASLEDTPSQNPSDESKALAKAIDYNVLTTIAHI